MSDDATHGPHPATAAWPAAATTASDGRGELAELLTALSSLRHDLKLQVRSNRALQEMLQAGFQRTEQLLEQASSAGSSTNASELTSLRDELRTLADAIVEFEENLQRALDSMANHRPIAPSDNRSPSDLFERWDREVAASPWWVRMIAGRLLRALRQQLANAIPPMPIASTEMDSVRRGLELLQARVHRWMHQCALERVDVYAQPFDAETMQATDFVAGTSLPSAHVAEQIKPLYLWRGKVFRCAQVRLAE